jgi:condensin complex subunit 3
VIVVARQHRGSTLAMPGKTSSKASFSLSDLDTHVSKIFDQAQISTANHQKNFVALHKLQTEAALQNEPAHKGQGIKLTGERTFSDVFLTMVARVLPVKKGTIPVDRVVKFVGGFTKFINEKGESDSVHFRFRNIYLFC